ncbi:hypothetical protein KCU93_g485, partial [Aureobasidium melanogenum]
MLSQVLYLINNKQSATVVCVETPKHSTQEDECKISERVPERNAHRPLSNSLFCTLISSSASSQEIERQGSLVVKVDSAKVTLRESPSKSGSTSTGEPLVLVYKLVPSHNSTFSFLSINIHDTVLENINHHNNTKRTMFSNDKPEEQQENAHPIIRRTAGVDCKQEEGNARLNVTSCCKSKSECFRDGRGVMALPRTPLKAISVAELIFEL